MKKITDPTMLFMEKLKRMPDFSRVKFVIGFGSYFSKKANPLSDYDFAVYYEGNSKERFKFRLLIIGNLPEKFDVQIYQDLPLYVQKEVLKGNIIYYKDLKFVYEVAYETIKNFEDFKNHYDYYLNTRTLKI